jgi:hypothetical protein
MAFTTKTHGSAQSFAKRINLPADDAFHLVLFCDSVVNTIDVICAKPLNDSIAKVGHEKLVFSPDLHHPNLY